MLVALVATALVLLVRQHDLPDLRATIDATGVWAPIVFVLVQAVVTVAPVPRTMFTVAAGVLFGSVVGILIAMLGASLAALMAFLLVRTVGGELVERHAHHPAAAWVRHRVNRDGLLAMISLRLIPMPFSVVNYASALSGIRLAPYLLGTVLGILPGTVSVVVLGDAAVGGHPHPALFAVSVVLGLVGVGGALRTALRPIPPQSAVVQLPAADVDRAA